MMITVNVDGHEIKINEVLMNKYKTLSLMRQSKNDPTIFLDLLDRLVLGGADSVACLLDSDGDPDLETQLIPFTERLFESVAGVKNSQGSQDTSTNASQQSEPTSKDITESTSMMSNPTKLP